MADISIDDLASEIIRSVKEYTQDVSLGIAKRVDEVADLVFVEIKSTAPKKTGEYAKSFKKTKRDYADTGKTSRVIWNKKHYRRVHLLEFGHAKRGGGRVAAIPHLRPAYEKHATQLPEDIKKIIRNGG